MEGLGELCIDRLDNYWKVSGKWINIFAQTESVLMQSIRSESAYSLRNTVLPNILNPEEHMILNSVSRHPGSRHRKWHFYWRIRAPA